jgi:hypothetical protein
MAPHPASAQRPVGRRAGAAGPPRQAVEPGRRRARRLRSPRIAVLPVPRAAAQEARWAVAPGAPPAACPALRREVLRPGLAAPHQPGSQGAGPQAGTPGQLRTAVGREEQEDRRYGAPERPPRMEPAATEPGDWELAQHQRVQPVEAPVPEIARPRPAGPRTLPISAPARLPPPVPAAAHQPPRHPPDRARTSPPARRMPAARPLAHARRAMQAGPRLDAQQRDPDRSPPEADPQTAPGHQLLQLSPYPAARRWTPRSRSPAVAGRRLPGHDPRRLPAAWPRSRDGPRLAEPPAPNPQRTTPAQPSRPSRHRRMASDRPPAEAPLRASAGPRRRAAAGPLRAAVRWAVGPGPPRAAVRWAGKVGSPRAASLRRPGGGPSPAADRPAAQRIPTAAPLRAETLAEAATGLPHPGHRWLLAHAPRPAGACLGATADPRHRQSRQLLELRQPPPEAAPATEAGPPQAGVRPGAEPDPRRAQDQSASKGPVRPRDPGPPALLP